jgi:hypothetical protein
MLTMDIFISYRRQDTAGYALGLRRDFAKTLETARVFLDSQSIDAGMRWREAIRDRLSTCDVLLVLIGDEWLLMRDGHKKIEDEQDPVRFELKQVLDRDNITIIPVLVADAKMPPARDLPSDVRRLCDYTAHEIHDRTYDQDISRLTDRLRSIAEKQEKQTETPALGSRPPDASPPDTETAAAWPSRITKRFVEQEVSGMGRDQLLALMAELQRRGWTEEEVYDWALSFSPLKPPKRLPPRITVAWLATNVPLLSPTRVRHLTTELRRRGWSPDEIRTHVYEHRQGGLADKIPARIQTGWLEQNAPLMTIDEQARLADVMLSRGWTSEEVKHHLPYARNPVT